MRGKAKALSDIGKLKWNPRGSAIQRHWDSMQPGLCVQVYPSPADKRQTGRRAFYVRFTDDSKQRFQKIGDWPEVSLDVARKKAATIRSNAREGLPQAPTKVVTVKDAWDAVQRGETCPYARYARNTKLTLCGTFENWVPFKGMPLLDVTAQHWLDVIDAATTAGQKGTARCLHTFVGIFYKNLNALPAYRLLKNPLSGIHVYHPPSKRKAALSLEQVSALSLTNPIYNAILQMLICTGQRIREVLRMRWDSIKNDVWIVGCEGEMKRKDSAHHLPMTPRMLAIVEPMKAYGSEWVFPGQSTHVSYTRFLEELKFLSSDLSPHVFRHTLATICADRDIDPLGVSLVLHHAMPGMTFQTYIHSQHLERKRAVLEIYQGLLTLPAG